MSVISFDLDGTVVFQDKRKKRGELRRVFLEAGCDVSAELLLRSVKTANRFYDHAGYVFAGDLSTLTHEYARLVAILAGCRDPVVVQRVADYYQNYEQDERNFIVPTDALGMLESLKKLDFRLAATTANLYGPQRVLHCSLDEVFEEVFHPGMGSPKTALFPLMLNQFDAAPNECVHIGDDIVFDWMVPRVFDIRAILFDPGRSYRLSGPLNTCSTYGAILKEILRELL